MTPLTAWSYSRYALYEECPLRFKLTHIDKLGTPSSPAMERGNKIHEEAARYLQHASDEVPASCSNAATILTELREMQPVVEQKWAFDNAWRKTGWFDNDAWLRVVLDAGVVYDDASAEVIDWKTGKRYDTNEDQVELFAAAAFSYWPQVRHVTTRLVYFDEKDASRNQVIHEFDRGQHDKILDKWEVKIRPMFSDKIFAPRPNAKCKWCDFGKYKGGQCRYG